MKKRNYYKAFIFTLFCTMLSFVACQKDSNEPDANDSLSQKIDNQGQTEEEKENALKLKGTAFGKLPVVGTEDPIYCNLPENTRDMSAFLPLCYDPLYDILYYVNYGEDFMIYAVRDGKSEVAVPFSGKRLFCRQGKLYFLLNTDTNTPIERAQNGNILSYDPVTGQIDVIVDDVFDTITVYQDCILCVKLSREDSLLHSLFYFYETEELTATENYFPSIYVSHNLRYKDFFFAKPYGASSWMLCRLDGSETIPLDGLPDIGSLFYLKGDDLIWFEADSIHFWNIPLKEERMVEINTKKEGAYSFFYNNYYYTGRGSYIDIKTGISQKCRCMSSDGLGSDISEFCTDGKRVYGFAYTYIEEIDDTVRRLCCIEWRSIEDAFALVTEDETALGRLNFAQEQAIQEDGAPLDGILLLTPVDQLFQ